MAGEPNTNQDSTPEVTQQATQANPYDTYGFMPDIVLPPAQQKYEPFRPFTPEAAQYLPQAQNVNIADKTNVLGIDIFNNPQTQIPYTSMALMNQSPSPNTKAMTDWMKANLKEYDTDPLFQRNLDYRFGDAKTDVSNFALKYGNRAALMLQSGRGYDNTSQRDVDNVLKEAQSLHAFAALPKYTEDVINKAKEALAQGKITNFTYNQIESRAQGLNAMANDFHSPTDELVKGMMDSSQGMYIGLNMGDYLKQIVPEGTEFSINNARIVPTLDENGKPLLGKNGQPAKYTMQITTNDHKSVIFQEGIDEMADRLLALNPDLQQAFPNSYDKEKLENSLMVLIPQKEKLEQVAAPNNITNNIKVGDQENNEALPLNSTTISTEGEKNGQVGTYTQQTPYYTSITPVSFGLGKGTTAVSGDTWTSDETTIGQDSKVTGIAILNTAINKDNGQLVLVNDKIKRDGDLQIPYAIIQVPRSTGNTDPDAQGGTTKIGETLYNTKYVPLSEVEGNLLNSAKKEDKASIRATIKNITQIANSINEGKATPENYEYFKSKFMPSDPANFNF